MNDSLGLAIDTIISPQTDPLLIESEAVAKELETIPFEPLPLYSSWMIGIVVALFFIYSLLTFFVKTPLLKGLQSFFSNDRQLFAYTIRQGHLSLFFIFAVLALLCQGGYLYVALSHVEGVHMVNWWGLSMCVAIVAIFIVSQVILAFLFGYAFNCLRSVGLLLMQGIFLLSCVGIVIFPLTLLSIYAPLVVLQVSFWVAVLLTALMEILLIVKFFQNFISEGLSIFYILLYLCTFKILLAFVYVKILVTNLVIC